MYVFRNNASCDHVAAWSKNLTRPILVKLIEIFDDMRHVTEKIKNFMESHEIFFFHFLPNKKKVKVRAKLPSARTSKKVLG